MKKIWYSPNTFQAYGEQEIKAVDTCLREGWLAGTGKYTQEFENQICKLFNKKYGLFVNSGSSACLLALACLQLPKDSEIITPACTFSTTVAPMLQLQLKPVFCDVELNAYVPTVKQILEKVTTNTKVIMIPNLIGNTPDWKSLKKELLNLSRKDIVLIEDSADTITSIGGSLSDIATTSFYSSHVITACGSGGMIMFDNPEYFRIATMFRDWGRIGNNCEDISERFNYNVDGIPYDFKFLYSVYGYNMKSSEVNAAFGLVQIERLEQNKHIRYHNFQRYIDNLKNIPEILLPKSNIIDNFHPLWLAIPLQYHNRLSLLQYLENNNIQTRVTFSGNITRHPAYRHLYSEFENADKIMKDGFLLGCHQGMTFDDVDYVCNMIKNFINLSKQ